MKKAARVLCLLLVVITLLSCCLSVSALSAAPYKGYLYNPYGEPTASPIGYLPDQVYFSDDMGVTSLAKPQDMFVYKDLIYIADTDNNRIVVLDSNFKFVKEYTKFVATDKTEYTISAPKGVYIKNDEIFVTNLRYEKDASGKEFKNGDVITADLNGVFKRKFAKPKTVIEIKDFEPLSVVADNAGYVYVRAYSVLEGLICYDAAGNFVQFFGANKVQMTFQLAAQQLWKRILAQSASAGLIRAVPTETSNMYIDGQNFIYTVTDATTVSKSERIRKLNPLGDNIMQADAGLLVPTIYGDRQSGYINVRNIDTRLVDIHVDNAGIVAALDAERSKVFLYDQQSTLLTVFGSNGTQFGSTKSAVAVEKLGNKYIVLDSERGAIISYKPTPYMQKLMMADDQYMQGLYVKGEPLWREVLKYDVNNSRAYGAIGKSLLQQEKYEESLSFLKIGQDRTSYSLALQEYRKEYVRDNYVWLVPLAIACIVAFVMLIKLIRKLLGLKDVKKKIKFS